MASDRNAKARVNQTVDRLIRNLREWLMEAYGAQVPDHVIREFRVLGLEISDQRSRTSTRLSAVFANQDQEGVLTFAEAFSGGVKSAHLPHHCRSFHVPLGYRVDQQQLVLHRQALAYAEQYEVDYLTAITELS